MKYYKLLTDSKTGTFEKLIEAYINDGWELHGPTFFTDRRFAQAIVQEKRAANKKPDPRTGKAKAEKAQTGTDAVTPKSPSVAEIEKKTDAA